MQLHSRAYALLKRKQQQVNPSYKYSPVSTQRTSEVEYLSYIIHKRCIALVRHMLAEFRSSHFSAINSDNCISQMLLNRHSHLPSQVGEIRLAEDY